MTFIRRQIGSRGGSDVKQSACSCPITQIRRGKAAERKGDRDIWARRGGRGGVAWGGEGIPVWVSHRCSLPSPVQKNAKKRGHCLLWYPPPHKQVKGGHLLSDYRQKCVNATRDMLMSKARKMTILTITMFNENVHTGCLFLTAPPKSSKCQNLLTGF